MGSNIISNINTQLTLRGYGDNPEGFLVLQYTDLLSNLIAIAGAILTIKMINRYSQMERMMHEMIESETEEL